MSLHLRPILHIAPTEEEESVRQHGLLSSRHLIENKEKYRELINRIAKRRNQRPEELEAQIKRRMESERWKNIFDGPNAFIDLPPDISALSLSHPLRDDTPKTTFQIDIDRLLRDQPKTRLFGIELSPYDPDSDVPRKRWITKKELVRFQQRGASDLWKDYEDIDNDGKYAPNVPHISVVTPSGHIDPSYLKELPMKKLGALVKSPIPNSAVPFISGASGALSGAFFGRVGASKAFSDKDYDKPPVTTDHMSTQEQKQHLDKWYHDQIEHQKRRAMIGSMVPPMLSSITMAKHNPGGALLNAGLAALGGLAGRSVFNHLTGEYESPKVPENYTATQRLKAYQEDLDKRRTRMGWGMGALSGLISGTASGAILAAHPSVFMPKHASVLDRVTDAVDTAIGSVAKLVDSTPPNPSNIRERAEVFLFDRKGNVIAGKKQMAGVGTTIVFPGGGTDNQDPLKAAKREVEEELGIKAVVRSFGLNPQTVMWDSKAKKLLDEKSPGKHGDGATTHFFLGDVKSRSSKLYNIEGDGMKPHTFSTGEVREFLKKRVNDKTNPWIASDKKRLYAFEEALKEIRSGEKEAPWLDVTPEKKK